MTDAVAYMRCSGRGQIDGDTWDRQEAAINKYAAANELTIIEWYRDEGISGTTELENRPGLAACLERVENNGVKIVIVEDASRLARDTIVSEVIVMEFQKCAGVIYSASGGINLTEGNTANPTAKFVRIVLSAVAELDKSMTVLKLRASRDRMKAKEGRCEGVYGFGEDPKRPEEANTLGFILNLSSRGDTADEIASWLNTFEHRTRSGRPWRGSTLRKILARKGI